MRILQLIQSKRFAGSERSVLTLTKGLMAQGHEVWVAGKRGESFLQRCQNEGVVVASAYMDEVFRVFKLSRFIRGKGIDLIHCHLGGATRLGLKLHKKTGVPLITHLRILNDAPPYRQAAEAGLMIANSKHTASYYQEECGFPANRIITIENSTDLHEHPHAQMPRREAREWALQQFNLPKDSVILLIYGRIGIPKGQDILLQAFPYIRKKHPNVHLLLAGKLEYNPDFSDTLKKMAMELSIADFVHFLGYREDIPRLLRAADLLLVPSLREPFGLVVIEGMMLGTPVVGANAGAIPDTLRGGELGMLHKVQDPVDLARAVNEALAQPEKTRAKADLAQKVAEKDYRPERMIERVISVYERALSE